jgi:4-amino-4-deoxy-L-arabinose transferase-like glycosyltransferase
MGGETVKQVARRFKYLKTWLDSMPRLTWLVGALLLAVALRFPGLGQQSLWVDEGNTYIRAVLPLDVVVDNVLEVHDQAPLYYLLLRFSTRLLGSSEFALRLPSVFFGVVNVVFVYLLGRLSGRRRVGVLAAWATALNPFHVWYSREARMYSLGLLLVSSAMWCFVLALRRGGWRRWVALTIVSGAAYLTHYATLGVGLVQLSVFLLTFRATYRAFRRWFLAQVVAVVPAAGWLALSMIFHGYSGMRGSWIPVPSLLAPAKTLWNFSLVYDGQFTVWIAVALCVFIIILWTGIRRSGESLWHRTTTVWLILLPSLALVVSFVVGPVYVDRYLSICIPAYILLLSVGLGTFPVPKLRGAVGAFLFLSMAVSTLGIASGKRIAKAEWREAAAHVVEDARRGDRLFVDTKGFFVTSYYVGHTIAMRPLDTQSAGSQLDAALCQGGRIWFLYRDPSESPHRLAQSELFDPYVSGAPEIAAWLLNHADQVRQEWMLKGVYLALLGSSNAEDGGSCG